MRVAAAAVLAASAFALSSCASILSPYGTEYSCSKIGTGYGKCLDLDTTYEMALRDTGRSKGLQPQSGKVDPEVEAIKEKITKGRKLTQGESEKISDFIAEVSKPVVDPYARVYEDERLRATVSLLKKPGKPIMTPDTIIRVLVLPYVSEDGVLNESRFSYFKVDEGRWVIGEYLYPEERKVTSRSGGKTMKPLEETSQTPASQKAAQTPAAKPAAAAPKAQPSTVPAPSPVGAPSPSLPPPSLAPGQTGGPVTPPKIPTPMPAEATQQKPGTPAWKTPPPKVDAPKEYPAAMDNFDVE